MQLDYLQTLNLINILEEKRDGKSLVNPIAFTTDNYISYRKLKQRLLEYSQPIQEESIELINLYNESWKEEIKELIKKRVQTPEEQALIQNPTVKIEGNNIRCSDPVFFEKLAAIRNKKFDVEPFINDGNEFKSVFQNLSESGQQTLFNYLLIQ